MVSVRVKGRGESNLIVKESTGVGSCLVDFRISVRGGSRTGSSGGILSSTDGTVR